MRSETLRSKAKPTGVAPSLPSPVEAANGSNVSESYPLDLVVATAAKFLVGENNQARNYRLAAQQALALIDACTHELKYRSAPEFTWSFKESLERITGKKDMIDARELLRRYFHDERLHQRRISRLSYPENADLKNSYTADEILIPEPSQQEDADAVRHADFLLVQHESDGFTPFTVERLSETFRSWRRKDISLKGSRSGKTGAAKRTANQAKNLG